MSGLNKSNKLNNNFDKFSILEFSYKNAYDSSTELFAKGIAIKNEKQIEDLGLIFTSSRTWNCHLVMAIEKGFKNLNHIRRVIPRTTKKLSNAHWQHYIYIYIYNLRFLCVKCLESRTTVSSTHGKTAKTMFKMDNLPFTFGRQRMR